MLRKAMIATCLLTIITATLLYANMGPPKPKINIVAASIVFDRYPHWQPSAANSREVVMDPKFERSQAAKFAPPAALRGDPYGIWQPARSEKVVVEFGLGRGMGQ